MTGKTGGGGGDAATIAGCASATPREGRGGEIGAPRAFAARSNIAFMETRGDTRAAGSAGLLGKDFLTAGLKGDPLEASGIAADFFDPVGVLLPAPSKGDGKGNEDLGRALAVSGPKEAGWKASAVMSAKEEGTRQKLVKKKKKGVNYRGQEKAL